MRLRGGACVLRRGDGQVQVGAEPGAYVLDGLSEAEVDLLIRLDELGARGEVERWARLTGVAASRARDLISVLERDGLLVEGTRSPSDPDHLHWEALGADGPERAQRLACSAVLVHGEGRVADRLERVLRECGLGTVVRFGAGRPAGGLGTRVRQALVVTVDGYVLDPVVARASAQADLAHLPVLVRPLSVRVGPLLEPDLPLCPACLSLHEQDADPAWPLLAAQAAVLPVPEPERLLAEHAAVVAARAALDCLGDAPARWCGTSLELSAREPAGVERRWEPHPRCTCLLVPPLPAPAGAPEPGAPARVTGRAEPLA